MLQAKLNESLRYFLVMPQPERGYDHSEGLVYSEKLEELYRFLGEKNVLRALFFLAEQNTDIFFDCATLMGELGIERADAEQIVEGLLRFQLIVRAELKREGRNEVIYRYSLDCNLISFLTFTHMLVNRPRNYSVRIQNRDRRISRMGLIRSKRAVLRGCQRAWGQGAGIMVRLHNRARLCTVMHNF